MISTFEKHDEWSKCHFCPQHDILYINEYSHGQSHSIWDGVAELVFDQFTTMRESNARSTSQPLLVLACHPTLALMLVAKMSLHNQAFLYLADPDAIAVPDFALFSSLYTSHIQYSDDAQSTLKTYQKSHDAGDGNFVFVDDERLALDLIQSWVLVVTQERWGYLILPDFKQPLNDALGVALAKARPHVQLVTTRIPDFGQTATSTTTGGVTNTTTQLVSLTDAGNAAWTCPRDLALFPGLLSGACRHVAEQIRARDTTCSIVVVLADSLFSCKDTLMSKDWCCENEIAWPTEHSFVSHNLDNDDDSRFKGAVIEDLQLPEVVFITPTTPLTDAWHIMQTRDFSQLPVVSARNKRVVGILYASDVRTYFTSSFGSSLPAMECTGAFPHESSPPAPRPRPDTVEDVVDYFSREEKFEIYTPDTPLSKLPSFFERNKALIVTDVTGRLPLAVVTRADVSKFLSRRI